ncbi:uncharacterized protein EI90DRAFT_3030753 [Cantharellus anzutake]|uniref:uncharacterized protein n=1 Tax=Cantharellus anzutake TaxID=1750568 RepID=UPI00190473BB|nr:uncharacterized protein EI90DRAFT_3030753 [Cantharellus anzutake]KAF8342932.1 hypothetical protein EI90DRAFT_3030753 [Cantharellus anzutake]
MLTIEALGLVASPFLLSHWLAARPATSGLRSLASHPWHIPISRSSHTLAASDHLCKCQTPGLRLSIIPWL